MWPRCGRQSQQLCVMLLGGVLCLLVLLLCTHPSCRLCAYHLQWRPSLATRALCRWSACTPSRCAPAASNAGLLQLDLQLVVPLYHLLMSSIYDPVSLHHSRLHVLMPHLLTALLIWRPCATRLALHCPLAADGWLAEDERHRSHRRLHCRWHAAADQRRRWHRCAQGRQDLWL